MPVSFNPCRVFKSAATIGQRIKANFLQPGFNPCRVFKSAATARKDVYISGPTKFQSLSGFQVRCNATTGISNASGVLFQSLSGFQVRCNLPTNGCPFCDGTRFNPCRVFKSAATGLDEVLAEVPTMFQSLSGFQVRCNPIFLPCHEILWQVSIPVGFSSPLQRRNPRLPSIPSLSFNPCRVFKSAATYPYLKSWPSLWTKFQSLSGFQVRCNLTSVGSGVTAKSWFQSLSGFQVRCNLLI